MLPLGIFFLLVHNEDRLEKESFKKVFGSLYLNLCTNKRSAYIFNCLFLSRRLLYALSLGFLTDFSLMAIVVQIKMSLALMVYIIHVKPFEIPRDNSIELTNEAIILT